MAARLEVRLHNTSGTLLAIYNDWRDLRWWVRVSAIGGLDLEIGDNPADQTKTSLFFDASDQIIRDQIIELRRYDLTTDPAKPLVPYVEGLFLARAGSRLVTADGDAIATISAVEYTDILRRAAIAWAAGLPQTQLSGPGETVIKTYALQNVGASALAAAGRDRDHILPNVTTAADTGSGGAWSGQRARRNLLEVLQEIGLATVTRFRVEGGASIPSFVVQARAAPYGEDRSTDGLNVTTGMNAAGNAPVIFSLDRGNLQAPSYGLDASNEATVALVLGQGQGDDRTVEVLSDSAAAAESPWNDSEVVRDARDTDASGDLQARGESLLEEFRAMERFEFDVLQTPATIYGRDYRLGDEVTVRYRGADRNLEIIGVRGAVNGSPGQGNVETISVDVQDAP